LSSEVWIAELLARRISNDHELHTSGKNDNIASRVLAAAKRWTRIAAKRTTRFVVPNIRRTMAQTPTRSNVRNGPVTRHR
jgi:hypothetical protein